MEDQRPRVHNIDKRNLNQILDFWNFKHRHQLKIGDIRHDR